MAVVTVSLRNMKISEHRLMAVRYAEELEEWLRGEKESEWDDQADSFFLRGSTSPGTTYCFNSSLSDATVWPASGSCGATSYFGNPEIYKREVVLTKVTDYRIDAVITVSWTDSLQSTPYTVKRQTTFTIWEAN
jgi:hypothetical protein